MKCIIYTRPDNSVAVGNIIREDGEYTTGINTYISLGMTEDEAIDYTARRALENLPAGTTYRIADSTDLPGGTEKGEYDKTFASAFTDEYKGSQVDIDIDRSKEIAHIMRKLDRSVKLAPLDIKSTIPFLSEEAESERQVIRDQNAKIQNDIDSATSPEEVKAVLINSGVLKNASSPA